jgi:hypothetical protein
MRYLILGLAVAGAVFLGIAILKPFGGSDGAQDNLCDRPLAAIGSGQIGQEQFDSADAGMEQVIALAQQGDVDGAQVAFFSKVHNFTHDVDQPLRDKNEESAKGLCRAVVQIEAEFAFGGEAPTVAAEAEGIRDLLGQAAEELGFAPRGR